MRTRRPLGTRARERLDAARAATRRPSVGGGDGTNHQGYDGARLDATTVLGRTDVEPDFRGTDRDPDIPTAERETCAAAKRRPPVGAPESPFTCTTGNSGDTATIGR
jgi:hypothetical protein